MTTRVIQKSSNQPIKIQEIVEEEETKIEQKEKPKKIKMVVEDIVESE